MSRKRYTDEAIISAVMSNDSIKAAAAALECKTATIYERMKSPEFQELYRTARSEAVKQATARLQKAASSAVATAYNIMVDESNAAQVRLNAALGILSYTAKMTETVDLLERIEALERRDIT